MSEFCEHDGRMSLPHPDSLMGKLLRRLAPNFGCCGRCGRSWGFVQEHQTKLDDSRKCFPLCERCWRKLKTPENRLPFYRTLWLDWTIDPTLPWPVVEAAVRREAA